VLKSPPIANLQNVSCNAKTTINPERMTDKLKVFCNRCNTTTNHILKCEHKVDDIAEIDNDGIDETHLVGSYFYQIIECSGCETITYKNVELFTSFMEVDETTKNIKFTDNKTFETFFPERMKDLLTEKKISGLPSLLRKAYREVIDSYNYDLRILCAGGLRAIVEGICSHYSIGATYLKDRIEGLSQNGLISKELGESLIIHKLLGDFALHRLVVPDKQELESAIHLIELTLETLFGVPDHHNKLKELITKRISK
jgi:hypothetical protein